jgi:DNA-binding PadR family transcriptional regulator
MSLHDILLSLLRQPMSGTDLERLFRGTINHFWDVDLSQIYKALEALEREGCVRSKGVPSARGPARKVYRLTRDGRERLTAWIRRAPRIPPAKFEYLAQLFSVTAEPEPQARARELLQSMREEAARAVAILQAIDDRARVVPGYPHALPGHVFYPWLTLRHGLLRRRALLEWIDECLTHLERRPSAMDDDLGDEALAELLETYRAYFDAPQAGASREGEA